MADSGVNVSVAGSPEDGVTDGVEVGGRGVAEGVMDGVRVGGSGVADGGRAVEVGAGEPGAVGKMKVVLVGAGVGAGVSVSARANVGKVAKAAWLAELRLKARLTAKKTKTTEAVTKKSQRDLDI